VVSRFKSAEKDYGVDNTRDLAELLTNGGQSWDLVRPHIICIKGPDEPAQCARGNSITNRAKCQSDCRHRVVDPLMEREFDESIAECVARLEQAWAKEEDMMAEM